MAPPTKRSAHATIAHDLLHGHSWASNPAVGPDGARIACVVSTVDVEANKTTSRLWLDGLPLTAGPHDAQPTWSPDGRFLAFTSKRGTADSESTLHILPISAPGETRTVCTMADGIADVCWSPDGTQLAFTSRTRHERYSTPSEAWQSPRKIERFFSRLDGVGWVCDRPNHIYVVSAEGLGSPTNLTPGEHQHHGLSWAADGSGLFTSAKRHDDWDRNLATDLYFVPLSGSPRALTSQTGTYFNPTVSPDGTTVAFLGWDNPELYPHNVAVGLIDVAGGAHRWISTELDRTFFLTSGATPPVWLDDRNLIAAAEDRGEAHLYRVSTGGDAPERLTDGPSTITGFDHANGTFARTVSFVDRPAELFVGLSENAGRITEVGGPAATAWQKFAVPCTDGTNEIDAWIMTPPNFDPSASYPVLLNVHGGPFTQYGETFFDEAQMQAAAGFVVVMSNPRGGSGRDAAWGSSILGPKHAHMPGTGWGSVDVDDLLAVIDYTLDNYSFCDRERVGMLGGSYGGYIATHLAGHHGDRFRAICSERAVNNMLSEEWSSDIATAFRTEVGPNHVADPDEYTKMSPIHMAHNIDIPMLLIHSEDDLRCPIVQAEELFVLLRTLGKDVTFYRFPGESHGLSRDGSPQHRMMRAEIILDFFADKLSAG